MTWPGPEAELPGPSQGPRPQATPSAQAVPTYPRQPDSDPTHSHSRSRRRSAGLRLPGSATTPGVCAQTPSAPLLPPVPGPARPARPEDTLGSGPGVLRPASPSLAQPPPRGQTLRCRPPHRMPAGLRPGRPFWRESSRRVSPTAPRPCRRAACGSGRARVTSGLVRAFSFLRPSVSSPRAAMTVPTAHVVHCQRHAKEFSRQVAQTHECWPRSGGAGRGSHM